jgi:hypothetical protein
VHFELARRQIELGQAQALAQLRAIVRMKKERKALDSQVSVAIVLAISRMYLRICVQVANALDVDAHKLMIGAFECEVREGLGREANLRVVDEARVRVVLGVVAVDEVLQVVEGRVGSIDKLDYRHLKHVDLFGRIVAVVDLGPQFSVHLQLDVLEVTLARNFRTHVVFGNVVARLKPISS